MQTETYSTSPKFVVNACVIQNSGFIQIKHIPVLRTATYNLIKKEAPLTVIIIIVLRVNNTKHGCTVTDSMSLISIVHLHLWTSFCSVFTRLYKIKRFICTLKQTDIRSLISGQELEREGASRAARAPKS